MRTRFIYLTAASLAAGALVLPLWGFAMTAPQYPDETLHLQVARVGITGDVHEITSLQQYIGVHFPTDLPELVWSTRAIAGLSGLLFIAAFAGSGAIARWYRTGCAAAAVVLVVVSAGVVQNRLYRVGHERDPQAPLRSMRNFTPPLIGPVKVGNFTVWSFPHAGAVFLLAATVLSVVGARTGAAGSRRFSRRREPEVTVHKKAVA